ncbi:MAG: 3-carboxy-cis,cis-muconate cycloisomerase [Bacteroidota bacterium]|jgi:3-carboxy-cis,cis-muconate cycloisomerase
MIGLYQNCFYSENFSRFIEPKEKLSKMLLVEVALAKVQAQLGIIPQDSAEWIKNCADIQLFDISKIQSEIALGGNAAIPLVNQLARIVKNNHVEASKYVHLGATSQDIIDTATVLEIKEIIVIYEDLLSKLGDILAKNALKYAQTVMMGRTLLQQAKPISFGLILSHYLESLMRMQERLAQLKDRVLLVQLTGAVSSGNSYIPEEVRKGVAEELGLKTSEGWHGMRDTIAEWAAFNGLISGFCGKIAQDFALLMQTEIGELLEGAAANKGGSSSMPHKRNPVSSALILANSYRVPGLVSTVFSTMPGELERSVGKWHAEWETIDLIQQLTLSGLEKTLDLIENMEVQEKRMLDNIELTKGLIFAENISLALSNTLGKLAAHELIEKLCRRVLKEQKSLKEIIENQGIEIDNLDELFNPLKAMGDCTSIIDTVLKKYQNHAN